MNEALKKSVIDLMNTCIEGINFIQFCLESEKNESAMQMLNDIAFLIQRIEQVLVENDNALYKNSILYCKNINYSIGKIAEQPNLFERIFTLEISPFCYELHKGLTFEIEILPCEEKWAIYRQAREKAIRSYRAIGEVKKFKVSIVIPAYNKLEYTKKAIESIYRYTDFEKHEVELITINNGSSDETEEYFNGLANKKKINLKYNILGTASYVHLLESEYIVAFSNDIIATSNWLDNLLKCIESDQRIFWVVPTCNENGISNRQGIAVDYRNCFEDMDKMQLFAQKHNVTDPEKWEERALLMPFVWIGRTQWIKNFEFIDSLYMQLEFVDDDLSTSLRRAGFKQILAKDTFMHHFGSVTMREAQVHSNSLNNMREVYYKKWGVDAWDSRGEFGQIEALLQPELIGHHPLALCIEPRFGGNHLRVKNYIKRNGIEFAKMVGLVIDARYTEDAKYMFDEVLIKTNIEKFLENEKRKFHLIYFGTFLNHLVKKDVIAFLEKVYQLLDDKGQIIFAFKNYHSAKTAVELLTMGGLGEYSATEFSGYNALMLFRQMTEHKLFHTFKIERIGGYGDYVDSFAAFRTILDGSEKMKNEVRDQLATEYYVVVINKGEIV